VDGLLVLQIIKAIVEIALMFFLARGLLVLFFLPAPHKLDDNFVYQLFVKGTRPFVSFLRMITPKFVLDRHLPFAAFGVLLALWLGLSIGKVSMCGENPSHNACEALNQKRAQQGMGGTK
jgi:hypothetical protein